jgi:hypothetical protein
MEGYIEIYQGNLNNENIIFSEHNMVVDGAKDHIVDIFTTIQSPSSLSVSAPQSTAASSFGVRAISLGCALGASGYLYNAAHYYYDEINAGLGFFLVKRSPPRAYTPIAPTPLDKTLQPVLPGPGYLGHFLNYYNFSGNSELSSFSSDEIKEYGCYLPSAGIYMDGSSFGYDHPGIIPNDLSGFQFGDLNKAGAINSEGYILESTVARASQTLADASGGFIVSGISDVSSTRQVKYILTLSYKDWKFIDYYYGGIGAIGLWTLDTQATLNKYGSESETSDIDLYNVADVSRNPIFKLFSKKVFIPGGLKINESSANDDYITITWGIKF